ncbi:hypothetical protein PUW21_12570 [Bacillus subtilis]|uniref:hypothetical protein n=1 Tax=Bacteria TaxID=2 RepID=UPI002368B8EA|nr:hypothetical protein [Bacillus subtilis]WDI23841.1 hypothetical protein PUW21_12570 [Bacillus subtilis]
MPKSVTQYDLLISCPSDVVDEINIIKETVEEFNRMYGNPNNAFINIKHWSKDSYPQSGGKPQDILNEQFVLNCDAAVAVFWTRFGTPTDKYGSGTEEEIEELIKSDKQVFLYFSDRPTDPSNFNNSQYKKVLKFRKKYEGVYDPYKNLDQFKAKFLNHLSLHFVPFFNKQHVKPKKGNLLIQGVDDNGKPTDQPKLYRTGLSNLEFIDECKENILSIFKKIDNIRLSKVKQLYQSYIEAIGIPEKNKKLLCAYADKHNIEINTDEFFYLGNLYRVETTGFGGYSVNGTKEENEKYVLISNLLTEVNKLEDYIKYCSDMDSKYLLKLCLSNQGIQPDEDIEVRLLFDKDVLCKKEDLPFPGIGIIEGFDEKELTDIYKPKKSVSVKEYEKENMIKRYVYGFDYTIGGRKPAHKKQEEINRKNYIEVINDIFIYEYYSEDEMDVICYTQNYIKHNTSIYLPSILVFNSPPYKIRYEINSKHSPEIMKGEIDIKND